MNDFGNVIFAFGADHVTRLTGLSKGQLRYWDNTRFFRPRYAFEYRRSPFSRVYSFKDVVGLRTLGILRKTHRIPLQNLRKVAQELGRHIADPWADTVLYVRGKEVLFKEPDTQKVRGALTGQYEASILLQRIAHDMVVESNKLKARTAMQVGRIERKRYIQHNAWVVAGTRIPIKAIWRFHDAGYSTEEIIREYPSLTEKDIRAAISHRRKLAKSA
jgi:uncharacterized protein (DUF433 family)